jgi:hypothetical protein
MTCPAASIPELPFRRIRRVDATFIERRKRVVTRRIAGNDENISGRSIYREVKRIIREITILIAMQTSRSAVGSGKIRIARTQTRATGINNP